MNKRVATACLLVSLFIGLPTSAFPQSRSTKEREADVRRLLDVIGSKKVMLQVAEQMSEQIRQAMLKQLPPGERSAQIADAFKKKFLARINPDKIFEIAGPIYERNISAADVKELIRFFESPVGQRYVQVLPKMTQETMAASIEWGQSMMKEVMGEMQQEFPELKESERSP